MADGFACRYSAAAPVTCGADIDVPSSDWVAVLEVYQSLTTPTPGANRSTQLPTLAQTGLVSVLSVADTVRALGTSAGLVWQAFCAYSPLP